MKSVFLISCLISLTLHFRRAEAQKLNITALVNAVYERQAKSHQLDTVFFPKGSSHCDFFVVDNIPSTPIAVVSLKLLDSLDGYLHNEKKRYVLKVNILTIGKGNLTLKIGLYFANNIEKIEGYPILKVFDERTVNCVLLNREWKYDRTLAIMNQ